MNRLDELAAMDLDTLDRAALERVARVGLELLAKVDAADLTPEYDYGQGHQARNRQGKLPGGGSRWLTPRELVSAAAFTLEGIEPGWPEHRPPAHTDPASGPARVPVTPRKVSP